MLKKASALLIITALALVFCTPVVQAAKQPVQLSLLAPIQLFPEKDSVAVFRFNLLYGKNKSVNGLDLGLVNHITAGQSTGIAFGGFNFNEASYTGLQWGFFNYSSSMHGLQLGFINYAKRIEGVQIGLLNFIEKGGTFPVFPIVNWSF